MIHCPTGCLVSGYGGPDKGGREGEREGAKQGKERQYHKLPTQTTKLSQEKGDGGSKRSWVKGARRKKSEGKKEGG